MSYRVGMWTELGTWVTMCHSLATFKSPRVGWWEYIEISLVRGGLLNSASWPCLVDIISCQM